MEVREKETTRADYREDSIEDKAKGLNSCPSVSSP